MLRVSVESSGRTDRAPLVQVEASGKNHPPDDSTAGRGMEEGGRRPCGGAGQTGAGDGPGRGGAGQCGPRGNNPRVRAGPGGAGPDGQEERKASGQCQTQPVDSGDSRKCSRSGQARVP